MSEEKKTEETTQKKMLSLLEQLVEKKNSVITGHPVVNKEPVIRDDYMSLLTAVALTDGSVTEPEAKFLAGLAAGLKTPDMDRFYAAVDKMTVTRLDALVKSVIKEKLSALLLLDAMIVCRVDGPVDDEEARFLGLLAESLGMQKNQVESLTMLAGAILSHDEKMLEKYDARMGGLELADIHEMYLKKWMGKGNGKHSISQSTQLVDKTLVDMTLVEGGSFMMGSDKGDDDEKPVHRVTVSSFLIGTFPVTQELWREVMLNNPSKFSNNLDSCPVEQVSWYDAVEFCNALSKREGLAPCYRIDKSVIDPGNQLIMGIKVNPFLKVIDDVLKGNRIVQCDFSANGYRLPTEAEWEFAARGGKQSKGHKYAGSDDLGQVGWFKGNSGGTTHPVGQKKPNELGLHDMSGNVWEWCWDWYGSYSSGEQTNPTGSESGSSRVSRGGGWGNRSSGCRVANRAGDVPSDSYYQIGLHLVRTSSN